MFNFAPDGRTSHTQIIVKFSPQEMAYIEQKSIEKFGDKKTATVCGTHSLRAELAIAKTLNLSVYPVGYESERKGQIIDPIYKRNRLLICAVSAGERLAIADDGAFTEDYAILCLAPRKNSCKIIGCISYDDWLERRRACINGLVVSRELCSYWVVEPHDLYSLTHIYERGLR